MGNLVPTVIEDTARGERAYDIYSRLAATHLPRFIPGNPVIVAKNMPGVGSVIWAASGSFPLRAHAHC